MVNLGRCIRELSAKLSRSGHISFGNKKFDRTKACKETSFHRRSSRLVQGEPSPSKFYESAIFVGFVYLKVPFTPSKVPSREWRPVSLSGTTRGGLEGSAAS